METSYSIQLSKSTMIITRPLCLEAKFIGSTAAKRTFNQGRIGCVHSVFKRAFNILTSDDQLISVVRGDVGNGPISIVTNLPRYLNMRVIGIRTNHQVLNISGSI